MSYKNSIPVASVAGLSAALAAIPAGPKGDTGAAGATGSVGAAGATGAAGANGAGTWTKYTVGYAALAAAGLTNDIELFSLSSKGVIHAMVLKHSAPFAGGLISAYTISVGIVGNLIKYMAAANVLQATGPIAVSDTLGCESASGATSIRIAATSVTALLNAATAGSVDVWVLTSTLP